MPLRPATSTDLPALAVLTSGAFASEDLFGRYMHPYLSTHPDGLRLFYLRKLRRIYAASAWGGADDVMLVSYATHPDSGREMCVTGVAHWQRFRTRPSRETWLQAGAKWAVGMYNSLEEYLFPDRALEPSRLSVLNEMKRFTAHHWSGTRAESWYLSFLGVGPEWQGQGFGRELVKWGFERAREDGCGCSVISSEGKEGFYRACGFDELVGYVQDEGGEENPTQGVKGGAVMCWDNGIVPVGVRKYGEK